MARGSVVRRRPFLFGSRNTVEVSLAARRRDGVVNSIAAARPRLHRHPSLHFTLYGGDVAGATEIAHAPCTDRLRVSSRDAKPWQLLHPRVRPHPQARHSNVELSRRGSPVPLPCRPVGWSSRQSLVPMGSALRNCGRQDGWFVSAPGRRKPREISELLLPKPSTDRTSSLIAMVLRYRSGLILSGGLWARVLSVQYCTATTGGRNLFEAMSDALA